MTRRARGGEYVSIGRLEPDGLYCLTLNHAQLIFWRGDSLEIAESIAKQFNESGEGAWTTTPPKEPGYYWFKGVFVPSGISTGEPQIVWVNKYGEVFTMYGALLTLSRLNGEWSDKPIQGPGE